MPREKAGRPGGNEQPHGVASAAASGEDTVFKVPVAPPPPPQAAVGTRVMVVGLASKPQYNGLHGVVVLGDGDKRRAGVKLDNGEGGEGIMLKPEHIIPEPDPGDNEDGS